MSRKMRTPVHVVCSSGGVPGVLALAGAVAELERQGVVIDSMAGVSAGAIVAALWSVGADVEKVTAEIMSKRPIAYTWPGVRPFPHLYSTGRLRRALRANLPRTMRGVLPGRHLQIVTADVNRRQQRVWRSDRYDDLHIDLPSIVRASMAIPGAFPPVKLDRSWHVDGGVTSNFPIDETTPSARHRVIGLLAGRQSPGTWHRIDSVGGFVSGVVSTMMAANTAEDIADAEFMSTGGQGLVDPVQIIHVPLAGPTLEFKISLSRAHDLQSAGANAVWVDIHGGEG